MATVLGNVVMGMEKCGKMCENVENVEKCGKMCENVLETRFLYTTPLHYPHGWCIMRILMCS